MIRAAALACLIALPAGAGTTLPSSGLSAEPLDRLVETQPDGEVWLVLRYVVAGLGEEGREYEVVLPDLQHLCESEGLPAAATEGEGRIAQIVVVLMDRTVPRGQPDPDARQFIGAYLPIDGACEWQ